MLTKLLDEAREGFGPKIHAVCDALGNPTAFHLTAGQCPLDGADTLIDSINADGLLADKAYDADERVLAKLKAKKCTAVIPSKSYGKKPRSHDREWYKARHLIENFFTKLKPYRALATRYDKTARNFLAGIHLAASLVWLN